MIEWLVELFEKLFGPKVVIDWDGMRKQEDLAVANNLMRIKEMEQKACLEAAEYRAKLEPDVQCKGCGAFGKGHRCFYCKRTYDKGPMQILSTPLYGGRPEWISSDGIARSSSFIDIAWAPPFSRFIARDANILGMSSEAINNFGKGLTP